jgi:xanthine/uracil/vitamin C permease (AzgA family)
MACTKEDFFWGKPAFCSKPSIPYMKQITTGDINSFLMLFFDNFSSLLGIIGEMLFIPAIVLEFNLPHVPVGIGSNSGATVADYTNAHAAVVWGKVCPGIGFALLFGNIWYAWMAMKVAKAENRMDVTALPYGINTPAGFLTVFMVQLSIMFSFNPRAVDISPADFADRAWRGACAANFVGGCIEIAGIIIGEFMRRNIPRAALFAPICGVGFVWLGYNPLIDVMREPIVGFIPLFLTFSSFFARKGRGIYPNWLPMAFIMMAIGTLFWWCGLARHDTEKRELNENDKMVALVDQAYATFAWKNTMEAFTPLGFDYLRGKYACIVIPIAIVSFIETIENVEMAHLEGDSYNVKEAMLVDGLGTVIGSIFGSTIPTTVYIGHTRHKAADARYMYSVLNALAFFFLMMSGLMAPLFYQVDPVAVGCILIAVGLMIVQSSMEHSVSRHYPCLMIGIMFFVSDMLFFDHFDATVRVATRSIGRMKGVMNMAPGGGVICSLILTAILCDVVDSRYLRASVFCFMGGIFSFLGIMHGANYVRSDGLMLATIGTSDADFYTTDLGELTFSLPVKATHLSFQTDADGNIAVDSGGTTVPGYVSDYTWTYKIDDLGFESPFLCNPWDRDWGNATGTGIPVPRCMVCGDFAWGFAGASPAHTTVAAEFTHGGKTYGKQPAYDPSRDSDYGRTGRMQTRPYNEGWRFAIMYFALFVICLAHYFVIKLKGDAWGIKPIMDNGYAEAEDVEDKRIGGSTSATKTTSEA